MDNAQSHYRYLILGAGRQGTAAAYDLARYGNASQVILADRQAAVAERSALRINNLIGYPIAEPIQVEISNATALRDIMAESDAALSAVPYYYNLAITQTAIDTNTHLCDMGGNTEVVFNQLALDSEARGAGISVVPDCGIGPGLNNTMGAYLVDLLDQPREVFLYDGGLPQNPMPPWNYQLTFHINGLTNEYFGKTTFLRNGEIVTLEGLCEHELVEIPPLGTLEAFVTTGGTSTAPYTFKDVLQTYQNKTLRYPGHFEWFKAFQTLGLFELDPIDVEGQPVVPRELFHTLLEPKITASDIQDVCVMRARGLGEKNGQNTEITIDLVDYYDPQTGFRAMERLTGWHCAIMLGFQARGAVRSGCVPNELAVLPGTVMEEIGRRGIRYEVRSRPI